MSWKQVKGDMFDTLRNEDRAVSPVIGVILMVAITVILAAVIGTFVLGLGDSIQTNVQAGASVTPSSGDNTVGITYTSNQNANYLTVNVTGDVDQVYLDRIAAMRSDAAK